MARKGLTEKIHFGKHQKEVGGFAMEMYGGWAGGREAFLANRTASAKPRGLRTLGGLRSDEGASVAGVE